MGHYAQLDIKERGCVTCITRFNLFRIQHPHTTLSLSMAAPTYIHNIKSLCDAHPNLPPILGSLDLSVSIQAGTPIDPVLLTQAKCVAKGLKAIQENGNEPLVTLGVVQNAELRAHAIEAAHSSAEFAPVNLVNVLQNINNRLDQMNERLDKNFAMSQNMRIVSRNLNRRSPLPYIPLQKTIAGDGLGLAQAVAHNGVIRDGLVPLVPIPSLGDIPQHFNPNISSYTHAEILRMISFYNDDFGIVVGDTVLSRVEKFRCFLSEM